MRNLDNYLKLIEEAGGAAPMVAKTARYRLHWRALMFRNCMHVLPGQTILEIGAGQGDFTAYLTAALKGRNPITAAIFNEHQYQAAAARALTNVTAVRLDSIAELPKESFDYVVSMVGALGQDFAPQLLNFLYGLLKPGGQFMLFEPNPAHPVAVVRRTLGRWLKLRNRPQRYSAFQLMRMCSHQGFTHVELIPYDILPRWLPKTLMSPLQAKAIILEHAPVLRNLCGTMTVWARKAGPVAADPLFADLAEHSELFDAVSVVVPCHNEAMNVDRLVRSLLGFYGKYISEILIVDDNSTDDTAAITSDLARREPRVRLLRRTPPNGVGRALRDGYAEARGRYILSMDCDFVQLLPEFRDLFDAIAAGCDGAIGSRFSHNSILINYPFAKIVCNRAFHVLVKLFLLPSIRDISNNLKLYRADVLKSIQIEQAHFAANVETGLKPLLAGYNIKEVPMSWINRTVDMGSSSFHLAQVGSEYLSALWMILKARRSRKSRHMAGRMRSVSQ